MNEEIATVPPLACDEVVVNVDGLGAIRCVAQNVADHFQGSACQSLAIRSCEVERPRNVIEVGPTFVLIYIERRKELAFARLGSARMVLGNGRAEPSGSRMNEEPKTIFGVSVELEEMIAPAERSEMPTGEALTRALERV